MRRFLLLLFVLCHLGLSTAWAYDLHPPLGGSPAGHQEVAAQTGNPGEADPADCHHACHALGHLLAVPSALPLPIPRMAAAVPSVVPVLDLIGRAEPPLTPPPTRHS